jgi:hypothetical protein
VDLVCCRQRAATEEAAVAPVCVFDMNETLLDLAALTNPAELAELADWLLA